MSESIGTLDDAVAEAWYERAARMFGSQKIFRFSLGFAVLAGLSLDAQATIVERVVAVVGERPILLSELKGRAKPFEQGLPAAGGDRATALSTLYSQMLGRMVDEELVERAAIQAQLKVSPEEVEAAIERVAKGNQVEIEALMAEVERGGVTRAQYRVEIRKQLLDAKLMNLRTQGRLRVSEEDVRHEYEKFVRSERENLDFRAASIEIALGETESSQRAAAELAKQLVARARQGEDFSELSRRFTTDDKLKQSGGLWPSLRPQKLSKVLKAAVLSLGVGEVSSVIRNGNKLVIVKVIERDESGIPSFKESTGTLGQRAQMQKMERARRKWLDGLRTRAHVELRL